MKTSLQDAAVRLYHKKETEGEAAKIWFWACRRWEGFAFREAFLRNGYNQKNEKTESHIDITYRVNVPIHNFMCEISFPYKNIIGHDC